VFYFLETWPKSKILRLWYWAQIRLQ
jgi:hypothetical protein